VPRRVLLAAALAALAGGACGAPAPRVSIASLRQLPTPLPYPFDASLDAEAQLARGLARARVTGRLLLVELGGNWCADCRLLDGVMALPEVSTFVDAHFVEVHIDVGRMDRNLQIPARYGVKNLVGVPSVLVIDRDGRLLNFGHTAALADARTMTPQALADWLAQWTP
jgi:thiol-disulfide isomerase/thioredoxin